MLDKEAQEKLRGILERFSDFMYADPAVDGSDVLDIDEAMVEIKKTLKELGCRKLIRGKPPLLSDEEIGGKIKGSHCGFTSCLRTSKAQRDSDIKWYEGSN